MNNENYSQAVFWIEVDKIAPNPYQPRKEFSEEALQSLADSIRQYGVLQPLVVTRKEDVKDDGGIAVSYELIAGERRLRAARLAGVSQVPAIIRQQEDSDKVKLELAIIENIQREDLNPVDRARAFDQLAKEFSLTHQEIAKKIGKSREYVSNTIRLLMLPEEMLQALTERRISEGHSRPILMLSDRPDEQKVLFNDIMNKGMTVREAEAVSRRIAQDRVRRTPVIFDRNALEIEEQLAQALGTRVRVERKDKGGKILIDFFSPEDLENILNTIGSKKEEQIITRPEAVSEVADASNNEAATAPQQEEDDDDLYSIQNFSI